MEVHNEDNAGVADPVTIVPRGGSAWFTVCGTEFIVIFIINAFTLVAFARSRHLRKRTTYLIINLTVADLLVGAVSGPLSAYTRPYTNLEHEGCLHFILSTLAYIFPVASQTNLSLISLERLHATIYPFRHCLIQKWTYLKIIIASWLVTLLLAPFMVFLDTFVSATFPYAPTFYTFLNLIVITVSYVIIYVKVRNHPPPQPFGAVCSDRKLSVTLFIVAVVSTLTILPLAIWNVIYNSIWNEITDIYSKSHIFQIASVLYYANSIVNPLMYAIRMQEFRRAVKELCMKNEETRHIQNIELVAYKSNHN